MAFFTPIMACLGFRKTNHNITNYSDFHEKPYTDELSKAELAAADFSKVLLNADQDDNELQEKLNAPIRMYGFTASIAEAILNKLKDALKNHATFGKVMEELFWKVYEEAGEFARDHPEFLTLIAIGILVMVVPWAVEALGFAELGPIEGSFAALWQSRYAGFVPKGSLFSFLQRCGMIWKH